MLETKVMGNTATVAAIVMGLVALPLLCIVFAFLSETACCKADMDDKIIDALWRQYKDKHPRYARYSNFKLYCMHFFGSWWNVLVWLLPI